MDPEDLALVSPRALEVLLRQRTLPWVCKFLKITVGDGISLEDSFANCWLLGRVAETVQGLLDGIPYHSPSPQLGDRPPRAIMADFERFNAICEALNIDIDTRVTLEDVEQRKSAVRVASCLWDVANSLRSRGFSQVPEFAPAADYEKLRRAVPRDSSRVKVERYENGGFTPAPKRPAIPPLPLDTSPALQKYRAKIANTPITPQDKKPKKSSSSKSTAEAPPSLQQWLPKEESGKSSKAAAREESFGSPSVLPPLPKDSEPGSGLPDPEDTSSDVLTSILSPEKQKPQHTQVLNAILRSDLDAENNDNNASKPAKRSLGLVVDGGNGRQASARSSGRPESAKFVHVVGNNNENNNGAPWWRGPLVVVAGIAAAVIALGVAGKKNKQQDDNEEEVGYWEGYTKGSSAKKQNIRKVHAGRW